MNKDKEIRLLRELVETQRKLIAELENRHAYAFQPGLLTTPTTVFIPSVLQVRCTDGCLYDDLSTGAIPYCKKCGQQKLMTPPYVVTSVGDTVVGTGGVSQSGTFTVQGHSRS